MKSAINNGSKLLIFGDGNSGITKNGKSLLKSSFFSQPVLFHQGISYLCHLMLTVPIGLVLSYNHEQFSFDLFRHHDYTCIDKVKFCQRMTNEIFYNLSELLKNKDISRWDALEEMHKWIDAEKINLKNYEEGEQIFFGDGDIEFNSFRYAPFFLGKEYYVFDKKLYLTYKIRSKDYKKYSKFKVEI